MKVYQTIRITDLPVLCKTHQHILKRRVALQAHKRALEQRGIEIGFDWLIDIFVKLEADLEKRIAYIYRSHIMYPILSHIGGCGDELGAKFIGFIEGKSQNLCADCGTEWKFGDDNTYKPQCRCKGKTVTRYGIECFDTVSRFRAFLGWGLPVKKKAGERTHYSPELKAHLYKLGVSFQKQKNRLYREHYLPAKERERGKFTAVVPAKKGKVKSLPEGVTTELHIHQRAFRIMVKHFIDAVYYTWRRELSLPLRQTYAEEYLGHTGPKLYLEDLLETRRHCEPRVTGNQVVVRAMVLWKPEATASHGLLETK